MFVLDFLSLFHFSVSILFLSCHFLFLFSFPLLFFWFIVFQLLGSLLGLSFCSLFVFPHSTFCLLSFCFCVYASLFFAFRPFGPLVLWSFGFFGLFGHLNFFLQDAGPGQNPSPVSRVFPSWDDSRGKTTKTKKKTSNEQNNEQRTMNNEQRQDDMTNTPKKPFRNLLMPNDVYGSCFLWLNVSTGYQNLLYYGKATTKYNIYP